MVFVGLSCMMFIIHIFMFTSLFLRSISCLCCVVHIMLIVKCLKDIYLCF